MLHTQYTFYLQDSKRTEAFGAALAQAFLQLHKEQTGKHDYPALLLDGELGTGKTTFTRGFVRALPCGHEAEVASPSFTLCHHYASMPPVLHADLYRVGCGLPEELSEALDEGSGIVIIEWASLLLPGQRPQARLDIAFEMRQNFRLAKVQACEALGYSVLEGLDHISWTKT